MKLGVLDNNKYIADPFPSLPTNYVNNALEARAQGARFEFFFFFLKL
jgi:hypothetical protein